MIRNPHTKDYKEVETGYSSPCYIWQKSLHKGSGIPVLYLNHNKRRPAARYYYEERYGPLPNGHILYRDCDQKLCIRPEHGTPMTRSEAGRLNGQKVPKANMPPFDYDAYPSGTPITYALEATDLGMVKIGRTEHLRSRVQVTMCHCPSRIEVLAVFPGKEVERDMHRRYAHLNVIGEWFHLTKALRDQLLGLHAHFDLPPEAPLGDRRGPDPKLDEEDREWLTDLLTDNPYHYADEIQQKLLDQRGVRLSLPRLSETLRSIGWKGSTGYWYKA